MTEKNAFLMHYSSMTDVLSVELIKFKAVKCVLYSVLTFQGKNEEEKTQNKSFGVTIQTSFQ